MSLWAPAWSLVLVIHLPFWGLWKCWGGLQELSHLLPWELLWAPVACLSGAVGSCWSDRCWCLSCPVLSHPSGTKRGECCDLQGTINILFQSLDTSLSSQKLAMFMEEIHCWRFWKLARICTIKLIKPLKKHSNSTEVSCCTASFPEEAVCIFKSVCKSFKSVLLQPQRVLQCSQKNCKEEIVNPWYSA